MIKYPESEDAEGLEEFLLGRGAHFWQAKTYILVNFADGWNHDYV